MGVYIDKEISGKMNDDYPKRGLMVGKWQLDHSIDKNKKLQAENDRLTAEIERLERELALREEDAKHNDEADAW